MIYLPRSYSVSDPFLYSPLAPRDSRELARDAEACLHNSSYRELQAIACSVDSEQLVLSGNVSTYYLKQVAQALVSKLDDVGQIVNRIEVLH
jgi:hypothetical protein